MKKIVLLLVFAMLSVALANSARLGLIPIPEKVSLRQGKFSPDKTCSVYAVSGVSAFNVGVADSVIRQVPGVKTAMNTSRKSADVILEIKSTLPREAYEVEISPRCIMIAGGSNAGVYYGLMTLGQILKSDPLVSAEGSVGCLTIKDQPRYGFRGLMIDPARNFLPARDVKRFIELMSRFKYNKLQLHLTDDQGWRMEILSHPELTAGQKHYTQNELRDIVGFAAERNVEVIPEIDIPGHTAAFLHAHPELMCGVNDSLDIVLGKTVNLMLCASKDSVYAIYDDIIREIATVFPSEKIHLGGDESAIASNWGRCVDDLTLAARLGMEGPSELMGYFFDRIFKSMKANGKKPMMWCELDRIYAPASKYLFPYPQDVTLVTWRNGLTPKCVELAEQSGNELIMSPGEFAYFDYPQYKNDLPEFNNWGMPVTTLEKTYSFDPSYGDERPMIKGVMGTLWAEAMPDINRVTYMAFPRALALAEAGWSRADRRDWALFKARLVPVLSSLMEDGVLFRVPFEVF